MFGKHFTSMYEGSMRGKGSAFFAVWGYVISHMIPNAKYGHATTVEFNAEIVAFLLGEKESVVQGVISDMCAPDPRSRTEDEDGRKLIKVGEYTYRVVNGDMYRKIRSEEERREYQRVKQAEYRAKKKASEEAKNQPPIPPETVPPPNNWGEKPEGDGEAQAKRPEYRKPPVPPEPDPPLPEPPEDLPGEF